VGAFEFVVVLQPSKVLLAGANHCFTQVAADDIMAGKEGFLEYDTITAEGVVDGLVLLGPRPS
jgi:hypothetical protein